MLRTLWLPAEGRKKKKGNGFIFWNNNGLNSVLEYIHKTPSTFITGQFSVLRITKERIGSLFRFILPCLWKMETGRVGR